MNEIDETYLEFALSEDCQCWRYDYGTNEAFKYILLNGGDADR